MAEDLFIPLFFLLIALDTLIPNLGTLPTATPFSGKYPKIELKMRF